MFLESFYGIVTIVLLTVDLSDLSRIPFNSSSSFHLVLLSCLITISPVISDPATRACLATHSSLSPGPPPSPHLQLISSLVSLYLYLSTFTSSLPDCLLCFAKSSCILLPCFAWLPYFDPVYLFACLPVYLFACLPVYLFTDVGYPACPSSDMFACMTDLPVSTLFACPSDSGYPACSSSDIFVCITDLPVLTLKIQVKTELSLDNVCLFAVLLGSTLHTRNHYTIPHRGVEYA